MASIIDYTLKPETKARIAQAWPLILLRIAAGAIIGRELEAHGFTRTDARFYMLEVPEARKEWDAAKEESANAFFDDAIDIAYTGRDPKLVRAQADLMLRFAGMRNPRVYRESKQVDLNVRTVDLTRIIQDANNRLAAARAPALIDHATQAVLEEIL
jgi:hypothetical protein